MSTYEEYKRLEEEEQSLTEESIAIMLLLLANTKSDLEKELRNFYQKYGKDGVVTYSEARKWVSSKNHTKRLVVLNQTVSDIFDAGFDGFETSFANHLRDIIKKEMDFFNVKLDINEILDTIWGVDESTWLKRLNAHRSKWTIQINNDLKVSILKQDSIADVLLHATKRGESMETILTRLWRTESSAVSSISRKKIYEELGISKYQFIHLDGCTCDLCNDMHGQEFPVSEYVVGVTANPLHPNCNDITVPVME